MKTAINFLKTALMISSIFIGSTVTLSSCDKDEDTGINNATYTISGDATGAQVIPSVSGSGTATISGTYSPITRMMNYTTTWTGLTGAPASAGFYTGAMGVDGTATGETWVLGTGLTGTGTFTGSITLTDEQATQLINGNMYYSYGTVANPSGEVRGQITAAR